MATGEFTDMVCREHLERKKWLDLFIRKQTMIMVKIIINNDHNNNNNNTTY